MDSEHNEQSSLSPDAHDRRTIWIIAVTGAIPMVVFAILIVLTGGHSEISILLIDAFKVYSTLVLSFLGGVRWGAVLASQDRLPAGKIIITSLLAPLIGWIAVFVSEPMCFALLIVGFAGQGAWDNFAAHNGRLPIWFAKLRMILTVVVILSLAMAMYATA